jgi:hypothetical protein
LTAKTMQLLLSSGGSSEARKEEARATEKQVSGAKAASAKAEDAAIVKAEWQKI